MRHNILNKFQKQIAFNKLNIEFNLINIVLDVDMFERASYTFYYKENGFIFSTSILYSPHLSTDKGLSLEDLIDRARDEIYASSVKIKNIIDGKFTKDKPGFIITSGIIYRNFSTLASNLLKNKIIGNELSFHDLEFIQTSSYEYLSNARSVTDILNEFFTKFKIHDALIRNLIINSEHFLESIDLNNKNEKE